MRLRMLNFVTSEENEITQQSVMFMDTDNKSQQKNE